MNTKRLSSKDASHDVRQSPDRRPNPVRGPSVLLLVVYFIPTFIAFGRGHYRRWQIFVGNLLLGWTFFVWCYCVILALSPGARETDRASAILLAEEPPAQFTRQDSPKVSPDGRLA